jgi:hypothetical protein
VEKSVRVDEVELSNGTLDPDGLVGIEMGRKTVVGRGERSA